MACFPSRKTLMLALVAAVMLAVGGGALSAAPIDVQRHIEKLAPSAPQKGKIFLDMAAISEDGANVLVGVSVKSPMTAGDYVKAVHLFAEENPNPQVATFHFNPLSGKVDVVTRIRLAKSQKVVAVAVMNDGAAYIDAKYVKITIGGCGGGN